MTVDGVFWNCAVFRFNNFKALQSYLRARAQSVMTLSGVGNEGSSQQARFCGGKLLAIAIIL